MKTLNTILTALILSSAVGFAADEPAPGAAVPPAPAAPAHEKKKHGGDQPKHTPAERFKKLDTDNNNMLSLEEMKAGPMGQKKPEKVEEHFKAADKDANGSLSLEEFEASMQGMHAKGKGKGKK